MGEYDGTVVFNYRLERPLGEGGFGVVYLAVHETLGRRAAAKILHPEYSRKKVIVDRFFREAKAVCEIGHPAIVDITNYGHLESGEPFYLMEFVNGRSIAQITAQDGPIAPTDVVSIFAPVASALAAAHKKQIIHRDLKPDNVMVLEEDGEMVGVKLLDFGIAKLLAGDDSVESRTGMAMGTPNYMAPEQARDAKNVDARADVYGFAATIFAALTNRPPFVADSITELIFALATQPAPRTSEFRPDVPAALDAAIAQCLEKDPNQRPPNMEAAWNLVCGALGVQAPITGSHRLQSNPGVPIVSPATLVPVPVAQTTLSAAGGEVVGSASAPMHSPRQNRARLAVAIMTGAAVVTAVVLTVTRYGTQERGAQVSEAERAMDGSAEALPVAVVGPADAAVLGSAMLGGDSAPPLDCSGFERAAAAGVREPKLARDALERLDACHQAKMVGDRPYAEIKRSLEAAIAPQECSRASFEVVLAVDSAIRDKAVAAALDRLERCYADKAISRRGRRDLEKKLKHVGGQPADPVVVARADSGGHAKPAVASAQPSHQPVPTPVSAPSKKSEPSPVSNPPDRVAVEEGATPTVVSTPSASGCSEESFRKVYGAAKPDQTACRSALRRLKQCEQAGKLSAARYKQINAALVSCLL